MDHPEFRYAESRNPYWKKLHDLKTLVYSDNETETHRGSWKKTIRGEKLHVELGCNAGHVILEWAARNPRDAYIGIDWKFKPIFRGAEKAQKRGLGNLAFFRAHSERISLMFAPGEVDFLYLFFPDPWPKKAHLKNRFINPERLRAIAPILSRDGVFHIKTDHRAYFDWMIQSLEKVKDVWKILESTTDLHREHPAPETLEIPDVTLFERLFIKDGIKINSVKLKRA